MPLPVHFDQNEWFVLVGLIVFYTIVYFLPRPFPLKISILLMVFGTMTARAFDNTIGRYKLDLYDIMDTPKYDLFDLILYIYYAPFVYFFLYGYEKLNVKGLWIWVYIVVCSAIGTAFEGLHAYFNVFTYRHWEVYYSFAVYIFVQTVVLLLYRYLLRVNGNQPSVSPNRSGV